MKKNITIVLDIDWVLNNSHNSTDRQTWMDIDLYNIWIFKKFLNILEKNNIDFKIVFTSDWRLDEYMNQNQAKMMSIFYEIPTFDLYTKDFKSNFSTLLQRKYEIIRETEILNFIKENNIFENILVIDDMSLKFENENITFIKTSMNYGFDKDILEKILNSLNISE